MKLVMPVVCECGFSTMDAEKAVEHAKKHEQNETLTAENVQVNLETLHIALSYHRDLTRDIARKRIVDAIIVGLDNEGKRKLEEYEKAENPCL